MNIRKNLAMVTIFIVLTICLLPIYGQSRLNNTANTIENSADENSNVNLIDVNKGIPQLEGMDSTELLNQVGEAAKKIAIGGLMFYLILAVRLKKVFNKEIEIISKNFPITISPHFTMKHVYMPKIIIPLWIV